MSRDHHHHEHRSPPRRTKSSKSINSSATSGTTNSSKQKKTKLEKICELQSELSYVKEENQSLKKQLEKWKRGHAVSTTSSNNNGGDAANNGDMEKLKEALRSLKRVTVKQEMSLSTQREKAKQRRAEIVQKDKMIARLKDRIQALESTHETLKQHGDNSDAATLQARVVDLELQLSLLKVGQKEQIQELEESRHAANSLKRQLEKDSQGKGVERRPSFQSLESSSSNADNVARLKRELAKKTETICHLQSELEALQDEIHDLKRTQEFDQSFPTIPAPAAAGSHDDFFDEDDEDEEDDFWGSESVFK